MASLPARTSLFPYTTLFRSEGALDEARIMFKEALQRLTFEGSERARTLLRLAILEWSAARYKEAFTILDERSEEHTSELQSPCKLVCRLLLEKKKQLQHRTL